MIKKLLILIVAVSLLPQLVQAQGFDFIGRLPTENGRPCTQVYTGWRCNLSKSELDKNWYDSKAECDQSCQGDYCYTAIRGGVCTADSVIGAVSLVVQWGSGIAGAIALLMFVIGGVYFLTSAGSSSRVQRGKDILQGTTIALFVILGSWLLVSFILEAFDVDPALRLSSEDNRTQNTLSSCQGQENGTYCGTAYGAVHRCFNNACLNGCEADFGKKSSSDPDFSCRTLADCNVVGNNGDLNDFAACEDAENCNTTQGICPDLGSTEKLFCCYPL